MKISSLNWEKIFEKLPKTFWLHRRAWLRGVHDIAESVTMQSQWLYTESNEYTESNDYAESNDYTESNE